MGMKLDQKTRSQVEAMAGINPARRRKAAPSPTLPPGGLLLAIDGSTTCTGWTVARADGSLVDYGTIKAPASRPAMERGGHMATVAHGIAERYAPAVVVCEVTSGRVYKFKARPGGKSRGRSPLNIVVLALAQGRIIDRLAASGWPVVPVRESDWIPPFTSKQKRGDAIRARHPEFARWAAEADPDYDATDSLGLAEWFLSRHGA